MTSTNTVTSGYLYITLGGYIKIYKVIDIITLSFFFGHFNYNYYELVISV